MRFTDWFKRLFTGKSEVINISDYNHQLEKISIEKFAIHSAINLIAGAISKCEFKTFLGGKEVQKDEYYLFNVEPNVNQNSTQFWSEVVENLLLSNECLVVDFNSQLIIADSFTQQENVIAPDIFQGVTRGIHNFNTDFNASQVLYFRLNNCDISSYLSSFCETYTALITKAIDKYNKAGGRKGVLNIDGIGKGVPDLEKKYNKLVNDDFKTYFTAENAVLPLFAGANYVEQSNPTRTISEVNDIKVLTTEIFDRVAQAFKIPPALLKGDIADIDKLTNNFLTFCIDPWADLIGEELNRKRYGKSSYLQGNFIKIDTTCIKHIDVFSIAANADKLIASSAYSVNEVREKLNDTIIDEPWANRHVITKNYTSVDNMDAVDGVKGGENIE